MNSKAPSVPPGTPTTVRVLGIAITATRYQALSRDIGVPISINRKVLKIDKNVCKLVSNRAVGSPLGNSFGDPRTVRINVTNDRTRNQTVNIDVSGRTKRSHDEKEIKRGSYRMREQNDPERPRKSQNPQQDQNPPRVCKS